jgi:23S rRNA pseudouridine2605 synthase
MKERIQKILANAGVDSRRKIEEMIRQGRVAVNGNIVIDLPIMIDPGRDKVAIDDEPVDLGGKRGGADSRRIYILLNKPKDVYSTNVSQGEQQRAIDLLPPGLQERVYPVGRLDSQAKGLLLLTNDGDLTQRLTHPRYGVAKTYRAFVDGFVEGATLTSLQQGVWLADPKSKKGFKTGRCQIKIVKRSRDKTVLEIILREGRNTQLRRMLAKVGHKVRDLTRTRFGTLSLEGLAPGESRLLTPAEVRRLRQSTEERKEPITPAGHARKAPST